VFLVPGKGRTGTLEHLLLQAVCDSLPDIAEHMNEFCAKFSHLASWPPNKQAKMKLQIFTAILHKDDPCRALRYLLARPDCPIPLESPHYLEIIDFLRPFAGI